MSVITWGDPITCEKWDEFCNLWDDCSIVVANEILWDLTCDEWNKFCYLWNDCVLIIEEISGGGRKPPEEIYETYQKLDIKKKKKLIKVIIWLKGERYEEEKTVEDYKVTVDDIKLLMEEYNKQKTEIKIEVSNITWS